MFESAIKTDCSDFTNSNIVHDFKLNGEIDKLIYKNESNKREV